MSSLYASSGPKAEGVPTNNKRGRGSGPCRFRGGLDKAFHIVPTALLVRVQRLKNDPYKAVNGHKTYSPLDGHWVIVTTSKVLHCFLARRDEIRFLFDPPSFVDDIIVENRLTDSFRYIFLKRNCTKFRQKFRV